MYPALLNQSPPAPYAMNSGMVQPQTQQTPQIPAYAHGGKVKRGKMVVAHMNPKELNILDHIQGKIERCPKSGMRSYSHLEELLKNPHILENVHHHAREHHAMGEEVGHHDYHDDELNHLAAGGMHGDSELALIGPHTHHVFNQLANGGTINPHDGHPQYWSLGNALGGLWKTVKGKASQVADYFGKNGRSMLGSAANAILPSVMPGMQKMATDKLGPFGGMVSGALPGLAQSGINKISGPAASSNPYGQAIGQGLGAAYGARNEGLGKAAGQGLNTFGRGISRENVGLGRIARGAGSNLVAGQGMGNALSGGFNGAGGMDAVKKAAMEMMQKRMPGLPEENPYEGVPGLYR